MSPETREQETTGHVQAEPAGIPVDEQALDPELRALSACIDALVPLGRNAQIRVALYLQRRFV